jgi:hypothetical protein
MGQTATTEAMPFWRSDAQPALLYCLFYDTNTRTASAIAARFDLARQSVSTEARRLIAAGIIQQSEVGRNKILALVDDHPAVGALRTLVDLTIGPLVDLRRLYAIDGVERVFVFGSWARRHLGEPGPTPRDIDVLVVGTTDAYEVTKVCLDLSGQYGVDVRPMIINVREFATRGDNLLMDEITTKPLVEVRK